MLSNGFMTLRFGENAGAGRRSKVENLSDILPLAGILPLAQRFQFCLTSVTRIDVMGVLKQRSAPNKQKLTGGADLVPPLFFDGQEAL